MKKFILIFILFFDKFIALDLDRNFYGNVLQYATFHIGSATDINTPNNGAQGLILGVSGGMNYIFVNDDSQSDIGLRGKYLFSNAYGNTHSIGFVTYISLPEHITKSGRIFSFIIGGGGAITNVAKKSAGGGYVEFGVSLCKFFPINLDLTYRASFYEEVNALKMSPMVHGINLVFNIL